MNVDPSKATIRKRKTESLRRRDGLLKYAFDKTSQSGEDGIIQRLFHLIDINNSNNNSNSNNNNENENELNTKWCVDVGAWDGVHLSNTYSLLIPDNNIHSNNNSDGLNDSISTSNNNSNNYFQNKTNWKGVLIEADPNKFQQLEALHKPLGNICINASVSCIPHSPQSLSQILSTCTNLPHDFHFLCIDIDGPDYWILHDILHNHIYRPQVICIEFNPTMPHDLIYIQPRKDTIRQGSSLSAIVELAATHHYQLVETTCYNAFFVTSQLFQSCAIYNDIPFEPTIERLHEISMGTCLYQLYDGTLKLHGCQKLLWHRLPIREDQIQVLDKLQDRHFPFAPSNQSTSSTDHVSATHTNTNMHYYNDTSQDKGSHYDDTFYQQQIQTSISNEQDDSIYTLAVDMSPYCTKLPYTNNTSHHDHPTYNQNQQQRLQECSKSLLQQLQTNGFAFVKGTGISQKTCSNALFWTNEFLQKAPESVRRSCLTKDRARRGYSPQNSENFASLIGENKPNDLVKKFRVGPSLCSLEDCDKLNMNNNNNSDSNSSNDVGVSSNDKSSWSSLLQTNAWPTNESWGHDNVQQFQSSIQSYYDEICRVSHQIVSAICHGLATIHSVNILFTHDHNNVEEEENNNISSLCTHTSILTLLGYRRGARHQGSHARPLVAAHTDVGVITVLFFDSGDSAILQRIEGGKSHSKEPISDEALFTTSNNNNNGQSPSTPYWIDVELPTKIMHNDPVFVVNIGDCLSDLSGGVLPSTLHRVMPKKGLGIPRNCLALFVGLKPDEILTLPSGECIRYEDWRKQRIARASSILNKTNAH